MKLFKIFNIKSKEEKEAERIAKEEYESREIRGWCGKCGGAVELEDRWCKQVGKYYHKKCWKEMVRSVR